LTPFLHQPTGRPKCLVRVLHRHNWTYFSEAAAGSANMEGSKTKAVCSQCQKEYCVAAHLIAQKAVCQDCQNRSKSSFSDEPTNYRIVAKLAIESKLVGKQQLKTALCEYKRQREVGKEVSLEEILFKKGLITSGQMKTLWATGQFWEIRCRDRRFCESALKKGLASQDEVASALEGQMWAFNKSKIVWPIGDVLVQAGVLTEEQKEAIRAEQKDPGQQPSAPEPETETDESGTVPTDQPPGLTLTVTKDGLAAYVSTPEGSPGDVSKEGLRTFLEERGITQGIVDDTTMDRLLASEQLQKDGIQVAEGRPPEMGTASSVKYAFEVSHTRVGTVRQGGAVDFKEKGGVPYVEKGGLLAEKVPGRPGKSGVDVYGNAISPQKTKGKTLRCGAGTQLTEDGLKVLATVAGEPKVSFGGKISVLSEHKITGDVGPETGHVDFPGHISIAGTVQDGYRVTGGNISAKEILKAHIDALGNVTVAGGITGATIKAEGDVKAKYIQNSTISAFGNVTAEKEIIASQVSTSGTCKVSRGKILTSRITAKQGIEGMEIGTEVSNPCKLKIGVDDHVEQELKDMGMTVAGLTTDLQDLKNEEKALNDQNRGIHNRLTELAQTQDLGMAKQKNLKDQLETLQTEENSQEAAAVERSLKELAQEIKAAEKETSQLFKKQDQLQKNDKDIQTKINEVEDRIEELDHEKQGILEHAQKQAVKAVLRVNGSIHAGTIVSGPRSSRTLEKELRNVKIKEHKKTDAADEWEIVISNR